MTMRKRGPGFESCALAATVASVACVLLLAAGGPVAAAADEPGPDMPGARLLAGFESPPQSARPRLWWHWINGDVTQAGLEKDLSWMHSIGIGGVDAIDVSVFAPQVTRAPLVFMSPAWKSAFSRAAQLTSRYGMELSIDSSAGWSETGGPWVTPGQAMKKLAWSETTIAGGKRFKGTLPQPPATTGPFQSAPMAGGFPGPSKFAGLKFYRDSLVIAYRAPVADPLPGAALASNGALTPRALAQLSDGSFTDGLKLPYQRGTAWIELRYPRLEKLQGVTLSLSESDGSGIAATVYTSADERTWKPVAKIGPAAAGFPQITLSFAPVDAQYVRITLDRIRPQAFGGLFAAHAPGAVPAGDQPGPFASHPPTAAPVQIHELVLHSRATVNRFEAKADFQIAPDYYAIASTAPIAPGTAVNPQEVVNLTARMSRDGTLDWTPPPGRWVVVRMGYSLEGTVNHPASAAGTGLEVDKLSRSDVRSYMEHYLALYQSAAGALGPGGVTALTNDSTEIGMQNWTPHILHDFKELRGYDPVPWLPALTGVLVGDPARSDRFLWDFRRTIDELVARNHYGEVAAIARSRGLVTYAEALESGRPSFGDDMEMRRYADVPMGAMWMPQPAGPPSPTNIVDLRGAASVAHVYGRNLVGAESLDSVAEPWAYSPRQLKPVVDREFTLGVNRVMIHESPSQPLDASPGLTLAFFGQSFDRLDTWASEAAPWISYIARCSYLLQQGHYAADIAYFYGQEAPLTQLFGDEPIDVPRGYGFDFVDSDALQHVLSVRHGQLVTRSGMRYRLLYLGGSSRWMTLGLLRRIDELVRQGATVVGQRPLGSPSLRDDPAEFRAVADSLFGPPGGSAVRRVGQGAVFPAGSLAQALSALGLQPDFQYDGGQGKSGLFAIHRRLDDGDLYFVSNQQGRAVSATASFRVAGRVPELWDAVTGTVTPTGFTITNGRTLVPLHLAPSGSVFVVFHKAAKATSVRIFSPQERTLVALEGPWKISFQPDRGAPAAVTMAHLASWTRSSDAGVRYFSGTATYTKMFRLPPSMRGGKLLLDLGAVRDLAKVLVNGKAAGILWTPPFRIDITKEVHPGINRVSILVTNLWVNRLIGDQRPGVKRKYTFTTTATYEPDAPLRISGLLGPVRIRQIGAPSD